MSPRWLSPAPSGRPAPGPDFLGLGNPLPVILADLRQTRAGVIAVVLLIAVAVALGVGVSAQERALREGSAKGANAFDLIIGAPGSETQLVLSAVYLQASALPLIDGKIFTTLNENKNVKFAAPIGFGDSFNGYQIVGTTAALATLGDTAPLTAGRTFAHVTEAVIGADVQIPLGATFTPVHGQRAVIGQEVEHTHLQYTAVGRMLRMGNPWDRAILVPIEAVWWVHGLPAGHAQYQDIFDLATHADEAPGADETPEQHAAEVAAATKAAANLPIGAPWDTNLLSGVPAIVVKPATFAAAYSLRQTYRQRTDTMAVFPAEVLIQLYSLIGDVRSLLAVISVVTQVLVIGAILLAVLATLALRRKTIAVLRALGASQAYVFVTVWLNVSLMIATGAMLGLGLGWIAAIVISRVFTDRTGLALPVHLGAPEFILAGSIVVIGLFLAAVPSLLTYRQPVSATLRQ